MLYIVCYFSIYEAPRPLPPGTVLRFDSKGNLIEIVPGTTPTGSTTLEGDSWRHEWWCGQPMPGVNEWLDYNEERRLNVTISGMNGAPTIRLVPVKTIKAQG